MNKLKTIAMYLPQFHEVPENNEWWGEGYTEWTATRKAEKLFEGHYQPREPLNDNYYDLLDKSTMLQQADLAKKYLLDGFCFYHYYFKDGRKILEKPAENLLNWKDVDMPFCFCWANESWGRTWSKLNYEINEWMFKSEEDKNIMEDTILLDQKYGREIEWKKHIEYLLPFFKDERYIKINNMPVFLIYKPNSISCLPEMINFWKNIARENGINNIYIIGLSSKIKINCLDAILLNGPAMYTIPMSDDIEIKSQWKNGVRNYEYEDIWKNAVAAQSIEGSKTYYGAFIDYDDTPRRGKNGWFLNNTSLDVFEKYLYLLMKKNQKAGNEFVFINAFNEWGEGMYLEPDKKNGYDYLKILKNVKKKVNSEYCEEREENVENSHIVNSELEYKKEKFWSYVTLLDKWMVLREKNKYLSKYLKKYYYKEVAVYGLGILGKHLIPELLKEGIVVKYIIDRKKEIMFPGIKICRLEPGLDQVDAIIVTATFEFKFGNIVDDIRNCKIDCPILSLEEMINEV